MNQTVKDRIALAIVGAGLGNLAYISHMIEGGSNFSWHQIIIHAIIGMILVALGVYTEMRNGRVEKNDCK